MSESITTARPYAQAAFDVAQSASDLKGWSDAIASLADSIKHPDVQAIIVNPRIAKAKVESLILGLLGAQASLQLQNFVRILVEKRRVRELPEIAEIFEALRAGQRAHAERLPPESGWTQERRTSEVRIR